MAMSMGAAGDNYDRHRWVEGCSLEPIPSHRGEYLWIDYKMQNSIAVHGSNKITKYDIVQVYKVKNSNLWGRYVARRSLLAKDLSPGEKVEEERLFHGTNFADQIVKKGFKVKHADPQGMFGKGIYFSNLSSKSTQYTLEGGTAPCQPHNAVYCTTCVRKMLICRVALGKSYVATSAMNGIDQAPRGYHSVTAKPTSGVLNFPEYIVYDNDQAYPGYLVEYKICAEKTRKSGSRH
ncbi:poly [ADP-ribose] polymerase tankyrase-like [Neocloeon triangulifer]|uniref:poly [ADP-ribose] polymerase tankyrase-like n=1 Tax=Neocloeon triangulifer TaxID=2078957 RepID=UPI00286F3707|nr:poly [ADP-ribose] polymerase tankyrase-like [Neocloeon triangulifer]XP_059482675.1 poly [ADP-ribose] polymerase tankyrase-like [Neocloeon triangulifer]XP_059482676.1 poly [ADP-ribose] polymerase tankyrase-like [Neocloeon triangulifer]